MLLSAPVSFGVHAVHSLHEQRRRSRRLVPRTRAAAADEPPPAAPKPRGACESELCAEKHSLLFLTLDCYPAEPAEDGSRPASAGRSAYDEDRAFSQGYPEQPQTDTDAEERREAARREALRLPPPKKKLVNDPFDDSVRGGRSGYGKLVDAVLPGEAVFVVGTLVIVVLAVAALTVGPPPSMLD